MENLVMRGWGTFPPRHVSCDAFLRYYTTRSWHWGDMLISVLPHPCATLERDTTTLDMIEGQVCELVAESFGGELHNHNGDVRDHLLNVDGLAFIHNDSRIFGFASCKHYLNEDVFYLHGVAIRPEIKNKGAGRELVARLMADSGLGQIAFTTQNPIMYRLMRSMCGTVTPNPEQDSSNKKLGVLLTAGRNGIFDSDTSVLHGCYDRCLYPQLPSSGDQKIDDWFSAMLNVRNGVSNDSILFIGTN